MRRILLVGSLLLGSVIVDPRFSFAQSCADEDSCERPPSSSNPATGLAACLAGLVIGIGASARWRRTGREEPPAAVDPVYRIPPALRADAVAAVAAAPHTEPTTMALRARGGWMRARGMAVHIAATTGVVVRKLRHLPRPRLSRWWLVPVAAGVLLAAGIQVPGALRNVLTRTATATPTADTGSGTKAAASEGSAGAADTDVSSTNRVDPMRVVVARKQAELGKDVVKLFDFVRTQIRFEPYVGVLRGARGTLLSEGGNSVDKALLLHDLLEQAGIRSRYVRGSLDAAQVGALVASASTVRSQPIGLTHRMDGATRQLATSLVAEGNSQYAALMKALAASGFTIPRSSSMLADLSAESTDHFWLQYRDGDRWIDLDPSFSDAIVGKTYAAGQTTMDSIPAQLFHRVRIDVVLEEEKNGPRRKRTLLTYEAAAADLGGRTLLLSHVKGSWSKPVPMLALAAALTSAFGALGGTTYEDTVKPVLTVGESYKVGEPFDIAHPANEGGGARPVRSVGDLGAAIGASDAPPPITAIGEWITFEFRSPDGKVDTTERTVFDRVGFAGRQRGQTGFSPAPLGMEHPISTLMALSFYGGPIVNPAAFLLDDAARKPPRVGNGPNAAVGSAKVLEALNHTACVLSDQLTFSITAGDSRAIYVTESPRLIISTVRSWSRAISLSIDLRRSRYRAVGTPPQISARAFELSVLRGVSDAVVEAGLMQWLVANQKPTQAAATLHTSGVAVFRQSASDGTPLIVYGTGAGPSVSAEAAARLAVATGQDQLILLPRQPARLDLRDRMAWWQIDRKTGETIAVTEDGLHGSADEYVVVEYVHSPAYSTFDVYQVGEGGEWMYTNMVNVDRIALEGFIEGMRNVTWYTIAL